MEQENHDEHALHEAAAESDQHYERTHKLLGAARSAVADGETAKALTFLIEAVEASTYGWGDLDHPEEGDDPAPRLPEIRTMLIQGRNCVSVLNEYAQKRDVDMPSYEFQGAGPFRCTCKFMAWKEESADEHRTKNDAKHDASEVMLSALRNQ